MIPDKPIYGTDEQDFAVTLNYIEEAVQRRDIDMVGGLLWKLRQQVDQLEEECEKRLGAL